MPTITLLSNCVLAQCYRQLRSLLGALWKFVVRSKSQGSCNEQHRTTSLSIPVNVMRNSAQPTCQCNEAAAYHLPVNVCLVLLKNFISQVRQCSTDHSCVVPAICSTTCSVPRETSTPKHDMCLNSQYQGTSDDIRFHDIELIMWQRM